MDTPGGAWIVPLISPTAKVRAFILWVAVGSFNLLPFENVLPLADESSKPITKGDQCGTTNNIFTT